MINPINNVVSYFNPDGTPTVRGLEYFRGIERGIAGAGGGSGGISITSNNYTTTGGSTIAIDLSNSRMATIVVRELSCTAAETVFFRFSTDGGTTQDTSNSHWWIQTAFAQDFSGYMEGAFTQQANGPFNYVATDGSVRGVLWVEGHGQAGPTVYRSASGDIDEGGNPRLVDGFVNNTTVYNSVVLYTITGTFDVVNLTVYRYN
jgi:hypothetical protein